MHPYHINMCLCVKCTPKYPEYKRFKARLETFEKWLPSHCLDPHQLSEAGFYYCGYGDLVMCFYCGVCICDWKRGDSPFVEHVKRSFCCKFATVMPQ